LPPQSKDLLLFLTFLSTTHCFQIPNEFRALGLISAIITVPPAEVRNEILPHLFRQVFRRAVDALRSASPDTLSTAPETAASCLPSPVWAPWQSLSSPSRSSCRCSDTLHTALGRAALQRRVQAFFIAVIPTGGVLLICSTTTPVGEWQVDHRSCSAKASYSSASGSKAIPFSPAALRSQYFLTHASQLFPAAVSRPVNARAAISE
jgi:hypothetical protein